MPEQAFDGLRSVARDPSLSDKLAEQLTEAILSKQIPAGARLPSERDMCERFKVSRTVVREAVRSLTARGLVRVTSGRGVEVNEYGAKDVADSMRLLVRGHKGLDYGKVHEVRVAVEVQVAGLAAQRAKPEDVKRLRQVCDDHERSLEEENFPAAAEHDFLFHRELTRACDNELLLAMLDSIAHVLREVRYRAMSKPHVGAEGLQAHRRILEAVSAHKTEAAREAMADHLAEAERVWRNLKSAPGKAARKKGRNAAK